MDKILGKIVTRQNSKEESQGTEQREKQNKNQKKTVASLKGKIQYLISLSTRINFFASRVSSVAAAVVFR